MKRWIHCGTNTADKTVDEVWDTYEETFKKETYRITGGYSDTRFTDYPKNALEHWFKLEKKYPMDVAIMCRRREDALKLVEFVALEPNIVYLLNEKWPSPYKPEYLVEECEKAAENGCKYFYENEFGDSVHPFSVG